jgi:hypothetical protein
MRKGTLVVATAALALLPAALSAQGAAAEGDAAAREIIETMQRKQQRRNAGVQLYATLSRTLLTPGAAGIAGVLMAKVNDEVGFRMVPLNEVNAAFERSVGYDARDKERVGNFYGDAWEALVTGTLQNQPPHIVEGIYGLGTSYFRNAGSIKEVNKSIRESRVAAEEAARDFNELAGLLSLEGLQQTSEGPAWRLGVAGLNRQLSGGFVLQEVRLWIDTAAHVPLRLRMVGDLRSDKGETRRVTIQKDTWDYVGVGTLYEPSFIRLTLTGLLGPKEMADLREAKGKLDEFKKRLAEMPDGQRKRMEALVGPQIRKLEQMAASGDIDVTHLLIYWESKDLKTWGLDALAKAFEYAVGTWAKAAAIAPTPLTVD